MSNPRDIPPVIVWVAVSALLVSMGWFWPDRDSPRIVSPDLTAPLPLAGAHTGKPAASKFDAATADALGLTLTARRQIERVFANSLALDPSQRSAIETQIDALPADPSRSALDKVERSLHRMLPAEQADALYRLVSNYRNYVREVRERVAPQDLPRNREQAAMLLERIDALRRIHFDEAIALALFGSSDDSNRAALVSRLVRE